jgi:hypothetical protein
MYPKIVELLGGREIVSALPELDIGKRAGHTDYIDFLTADDVPLPTVYRGVDVFRRPFLTFAHPRGVMTLFQRYTNETHYWTHGGQLPNDACSHGGINFTDPAKASLDERVIALVAAVGGASHMP